MDLALDAPDVEFQERVAEWLRGNLPAGWRHRYRSHDDRVSFLRQWDRKLYEGGWGGIWWPSEWGGLDATPMQRAIFEEEVGRAGAPDGLGQVGRRLIGPGIIAFGTSEQKLRFLPAILRSEEIWCQGYSEPDAGSDLASVRTRAVRRGEEYIVNGTKIWTSFADHADWCFVLVRTDPDAEKHEGLSVLLVDMHAPGVVASPIRQINGSSEFCEVHFSDVRVPVSALLGKDGQGWEVATYILTYERGAAMVFGRLSTVEQNLRAYLDIAGDDVEELEHVGRHATEVATARLLAFQVLSDQLSGGEPGVAGSVTKLYWSEAWQRLSERAMVFAGTGGLGAGRGESVGLIEEFYLLSRCATISAGSSEIQRGIVSRQILGLPSGRA